MKAISMGAVVAVISRILIRIVFCQPQQGRLLLNQKGKGARSLMKNRRSTSRSPILSGVKIYIIRM
jgi:hypothetical protein